MKNSFRRIFSVCFAAFVLVGTVSSSEGQSTTAYVSIKAVNGQASCSTLGAPSQPVQVGDVIKPGSFIRSGPDSTVDVILQDSGTVLRLLPNSELEFAVLKKQPAGEQIVTKTSLKLLKGSIVGAQRKLAVPSHFNIVTANTVATIVGTEYVVNADGAVTVLEGVVSINYNQPGNQGSVKVTIPQGSTFDPATGTVVPTSSQYLENIIADINTVKKNAQVFKTGSATIVVRPESFISPIKGNNGVGNGVDPQPPGNPPINDGPGTGPGNPGNKGGSKN